MTDLTRPHGSRFRDAIAIVNPGACNPSGIAHSIVDACREIRARARSEHCPRSGGRLMVYKLASICGVVDYPLDRYMADEGACKDRVAELGLKPMDLGSFLYDGAEEKTGPLLPIPDLHRTKGR
jgi:hypothetical protein